MMAQRDCNVFLAAIAVNAHEFNRDPQNCAGRVAEFVRIPIRFRMRRNSHEFRY